jgi:hypothetical protein
MMTSGRSRIERALLATTVIILWVLIGSACNQVGYFSNRETATGIPFSPTVATFTSTISPTATISPSHTGTEFIPSSTPVPPTVTLPTDTQVALPSVNLVLAGTPAITLSSTSTIVLYPTWTLRPTLTPRPTFTPSITPTPTPPFALLRINNPGLMSMVTSPIQVEAQVMPGEDGMVRVDLIGEDGRYITRKVLDYRIYANRRIGIVPDIDFKIPGVAETARMVISIEDGTGRITGITSVEVILLSIGRDDINPPIGGLEPYIVRYPEENQVIKGGVLLINALARPVNSKPLILELVNENGVVISSKEVKITPPSGNLSHMPFQELLNYSVTAPTHVRLCIRQVSDDRIPGTVSLSSIPLVLEP